VKPLLTFLTPFLMLCGVASAEKILMVCTHQVNNYNYSLMIDINLKKLKLGPFNEVNINNIDSTNIFAQARTPDSNIYFSYHKQSKELIHAIYSTDNKKILYNNYYNCN
jgi:hypothetical protein